ncbi:uncharacterized protein LOC129772921 [Toxorhynchites rutilus septentrionalis]|uniref:uncharacterized protein LOC129772921 n=1 Tax=Toxorhynchites rutilus septentrionalis TaxID=329112 RepID=UPI00247B0BDD|nr:uncharacterized protein LOC129772921 [Toxorhynchites rutilus septentrionalis]
MLCCTYLLWLTDMCWAAILYQNLTQVETLPGTYTTATNGTDWVSTNIGLDHTETNFDKYAFPNVAASYNTTQILNYESLISSSTTFDGIIGTAQSISLNSASTPVGDTLQLVTEPSTVWVSYQGMEDSDPFYLNTPKVPIPTDSQSVGPLSGVTLTQQWIETTTVKTLDAPKILYGGPVPPTESSIYKTGPPVVVIDIPSTTSAPKQLAKVRISLSKVRSKSGNTTKPVRQRFGVTVRQYSAMSVSSKVNMKQQQRNSTVNRKTINRIG